MNQKRRLVILLCSAWAVGVAVAAASDQWAEQPDPVADRTGEIWVEPASGIELVYLPGGSFLMGSPAEEIGRESGEVLHPVVITRPFYIGRFEVTQGQWEAVMGSQPSQFAACGVDCPVEGVSFSEIREFLSTLNARSGERLRLPTEAEWEYACRAGSELPFSSGARLTLGDANFDARLEEEGTFRGSPTPVGTFAPNLWGLYDMHGNVWEWCEDWHCPYPEGPVEDPVGRCDSGLRVIRGGSWYYGSDSARCGLRYTHAPDDAGPSLGFRVVREIAE